MKWWEDRRIAVIWGVLRIWLGIQWLEAGWHKLGGFDTTGFLQGAIAKAGGEYPEVQGWYAAFLDKVAMPNAGVFNFLIPWGEILVGLGLILGLATIPALIAAAFMNLNFLLAGTLSTNPIFFTLAIILLFAHRGTCYWGMDRFAIPYVKQFFQKGKIEHKMDLPY